MKLYSFWRSMATFRVRIVLNLKGIDREVVTIDLVKGEQRDDAYRAVNPQMVIPALIDGDGPPLFQSLAICEYLDETHPEPPLLPKDARGRARVRGLAQIVACDAHPLIVPRIRNYLETELKLDEATRTRWIQHWIGEGLRTLETHLARDAESGRYAHGDAVTLADVCVTQQVVSGRIFGCDMSPYPTATRIADLCLQQDAFASAHPLKQPGAPKELAH